MSKRMRITESRCLALHTVLKHMEEALKEEVIPFGIEIDVTDCGSMPIYIHVSGKIRTISGRKLSCLCAVHLDKDWDEEWYPKFVDAIINLNGEECQKAEINYSAAKFFDRQKMPCDDGEAGKITDDRQF